MADANINQSEITVLSVLRLAQDELINDGMESSITKEVSAELRKLMSSVSKKHFGSIRQRHKHELVGAFPMLTRIAQRWYKTFMRRMIPRCGGKNPWRVIVSENLSRELFDVIQQIVSRTSYGVITHSTRKRIVMAFTKDTRVRRLFCEIIDSKIKPEKFLKRSASGRKKVEAIIDEEKQFGLSYNSETEEITFDFFYGAWNEYGWPQHI